MSKEIFDFIKPDENDELSKIDRLEQKEFLRLLNNYFLEYRDTLGHPYLFTFGIELEFEEANLKKIYNGLKKLGLEDTWNLKGENTVKNGGEIASLPLRDNESTWEELQSICKLLQKYAQNGENCGAHIHLGAHVFENKREALINFLQIYGTYEHIIYRFGYGEYLNARPFLAIYAAAIQKILLEEYHALVHDQEISIKEIFHSISFANKNQGLNFCYAKSVNKYSRGNTIEFRHFNGTFEEIIWQNNINFLINLVKYCKSPGFDRELIQYRELQNEKLCFSTDDYHKIFLEQALELTDLIFTNNLDKIYFLRQYLKTMQVVKNHYLFPALPFTRAKIKK